MASPDEVTVPTVEDMVMVKVEDGDPDDPNKTQVILQLQQITGDESSEASAAVMAVEAAPEQGEEEVEIGCPITCGDCKALLILKKFVCPGINVKCVKFGDQLISPKQFVHLSGKATLKDWKRAIRMNGVMLRKMMDSGQLDFYEHTTLCTNTCRSTKFDLLINNTRFPPDGTGLTTPTQGQTVLGNGGTGGDGQTEGLGAKLEWSSGDTTEKSNEISEDTLNFWKGIADVGLLGEVVTNINTELLALLNGVQQRSEPGVLQDTDSCLVEVAVLSNLAQVFGLLDTVKRILERRREQTDPNQEEELRVLNNLELQLEEQKKQQQVRALLSCPQPPKIKTPTKRPTKRPRLTRPASTTTLLASPQQTATLQPQQFTVLSPISLTSVGQPLTVTGLPIASLAQSPNTVTLLPAGSQFFTRYMVAGDGKTDTITLHPSSGLTLDSSQLGAMMNPVELVQLSQQGGSTEMVPLDGQVVVQQEGEVQDQALGVMELQLTGDAAKDAMMVQSGMEVAMATEGEEPQCQTQEGQTDTTQGLQLDASGQLQGVQIVVLEN
ncbi:glucocorticoid modulatory element-binding protein 1 isoform X1 [Boleophthalmus pectinirostris]|uniref:glucocorticoid modulatory element-binding protein 1 isoform X1 n=1 Tax=Boleophthalmus pectinirostris TaxID=150288 RepID=UPI000A1C322B|nr:glucocorticoid modulatory element-binding protein 1 isoform X1 [Boleophthalmus pectinirostris]XP_055013491.1 glucocorticoid modulatory element-binding protein 1 isoform X1 [Boleophthalmus pectinirostris]XP_055013492.1 glucocorticoid modulatory element-binding protein 1 isoform X1 [Boleophthalmus pectinirostris]